MNLTPTITTSTNTYDGYISVYPGTYTWPVPTTTYVPYVIQGDPTMSKFEQAFKVASALLSDEKVVVADVSAFIALVKLIEEAL